MSLGFLGISPIDIALNNNNFEVSLTQTDIGLNPIFNTSPVALYDGNINSLTLDKFGRITNISTGYTLPTPNQINYLKIAGDVGIAINAQITDLSYSDTITFIGKPGHISTQIIDKKIISELTATGITNPDVYTYEVNNTNAVTSGFQIRGLNTTAYTTSITLSKGKEYIFRQYDNTSTESSGELSVHAIGISINGGNVYNDGVEYFIKDSQGKLLGPLSYIDYNINFLIRGVARQPYVKIKLQNNAPTTIYMYSQFTPSNVHNISLNILSEIEYITYNNVNSLVVDSYGRLHTVGQMSNSDNIMSRFNVRADDSNQFIIKHNEILDILGENGHMVSYIQNNKLYSRLAETKIISTNIDNVDVIVEQTVDVINGGIKWYNLQNTEFTKLNILKGRIFKFLQINPLTQTHSMGISTSQISVVEYIVGIEYHVVIGGTDTVVTANNYNNYFINPRLNGSSAYILFNVPYDAPSKLYMYSRFSSFITKMELNVIGDFRRIDNVLSITVDRFGRIHDALSTVDNNRVEFIIEMVGYNTLSFGLIEQSIYIQTLIAFFTVINYGDVSLNLADVNDVVHITTSINEVSTLKSQSIIANISNLKNIANTATVFNKSLQSGGLSLLINFNIIQAGLNIVVKNDITLTSFNVNVNNKDINITDLSTLKLENIAPIVLTENINNKSVQLSLEKISGSTKKYTGGVSEINVDTFGRVTNVVTGSQLPVSGVIAGTYNPSISEIVVNKFGVITSIKANNLPTEITNEITRATRVETALTTSLNEEISRATSAESTLTINLNNEIAKTKTSENTHNVAIINEMTRAIDVEGLLSNLKTVNKTSLVNAINSEITRAIDIETINTTAINSEITRATFAEDGLKFQLNNEITRATTMEATINTTLNIIGPLTNYSPNNTLISNLGNLNNLVGAKTNLLEYINSIGNIDEYNTSSTLLTALGSLSKIPSGSSISEFILKYGEANLLTLATGRKTLLEIIGNELVVAKYSFGPPSLTFGGAFDRDNFFPLFTSINNLNTWKNTNIIAILDLALTRVIYPSTEYTNIQNFKNNFVFGVAIGPNQTINHAWNVVFSYENVNQIYYTITHKSATSNPSISFTNTRSIAETITIPLNNAGTFSNSIIGDIVSLQGQVSILNASVGVSNSSSGTGADILGKLSALGDAPSFQTNMNSRTMVNVIGILPINSSITWNNKTILGIIGEPTKISNTTDITSELQCLGTLNDYSTNTLISKIGNISKNSSTLKDIVDAIGDITTTYNVSNTLLNNLYTRSQIDTQIANVINSAPGALNTLNELAASLGNDANFSTTITKKLTNITDAISNIENTALSTWPGSTNLTKLGTITTGLWQGTKLEINRINWVNKINVVALQTDLPAASNNSLIARVVGDGLYFSDGQNYKKLSNFDDVVALLSDKQTSITSGPLTNILAGPDFSTNKVIISGGAGKIVTSAITSTQLNCLGDVTDLIQSQLDGKQIKLSSGSIPLETINGVTMTLAQLNHIAGVTGPIQTQLDSKQNTITGAAATVISSNLTINRALLSDDAGKIVVSTISKTQLNCLDGVTSAIQTQLDSKQNTITGAAATVISSDLAINKALLSDGAGKIVASAITKTQLNYLGDVTNLIQSQLDGKQIKLSSGSIPLETINGVTMTLAQLNYIAGVTGPIQTQLDAKQNTITGAATTVTSNNLTIDRALLSDGTGKIVVSAISKTQLNCLDGVTSAIQTQLDSKQNTITGAAATVISNNLTINRALLSDGAGKIVVSTISKIQLNCLDGVTIAIQTQLDSKQNTITGAAATVISSDLAINRALLSDGAGKIVVSTISNIQLNYLGGVTSAIQTQLDGKQIKLSSGSIPLETINGVTMTLAQLNHIAGVTGPIQTQLDAKQKIITGVSDAKIGYLSNVTSDIQVQLNNVQYKIENKLIINTNNIALSCQDNIYPTIFNQSIYLSQQYQAWGLYSASTGLNYSLPWRIIFKQQMLFKHSGETGFILGFNHNIDDAGWVNGGDGGQFQNNNISLKETPANVTVTTFLVNNTTGIPSTYFDINNPTYTEITRLSNGKTDIRLYNSTFSEIYYTQITTILPYNTDMVFTLFYNRHRAIVSSILFEQGNTITPQSLNNVLNMDNYIQLQINNTVFSNYKSYFGQFLDYYVSLNTDGTIKLTGQQCTTGNLKIKFSLQLSNSSTRTLYDNISLAPSPNLYVKNEDGVTWFKPPYDFNAKPSNTYNKPALLLTGLDTEIYEDFGFTIVFYLKNFKYKNVPSSNYSVENIMSLFSDDVANSEIIKSNILFFDEQYEHKLTSSKYRYDILRNASAPRDPRYQWGDTAKFKNADIKRTSVSTGVFKQYPEDVWFVAHTFKSGVLIGSDFGENIPNDNKRSQFFYKRTNFDKLNAGMIWEPTWAAGPDTTWMNAGLSKHFKKNSWLVFGATKEDGDISYPSGGLTTANWESYKIDVNGIDYMEDVDLSEIMIFNKALTYEELSKLSKLSPSEAKSMFC